MAKSKKDEKEKEIFNREIITMKDIKCPYSVEYYNHFEDEDLKSFLERNKSGLSDSMIKYILLQLNEVFKIMRFKNRIHRDLKPQNILRKYISQNMFIIKLADFGNSRKFNNNSFSTQVGTFGYFAPELSDKKNNYDLTKCDLWSIGVIIY